MSEKGWLVWFFYQLAHHFGTQVAVGIAALVSLMFTAVGLLFYKRYVAEALNYQRRMKYESEGWRWSGFTFRSFAVAAMCGSVIAFNIKLLWWWPQFWPIWVSALGVLTVGFTVVGYMVGGARLTPVRFVKKFYTPVMFWVSVFFLITLVDGVRTFLFG